MWDCHICRLPANFGWRHRCRGCDALKESIRGGNGVSGATSTIDRGSSQASTLAERQLRQMREENRRRKKEDDEEKKQLRAALARMREEAANKEKSRGAAEDAGDEVEGEDMDVSANMFSSWTEEERQKRLDEARAGLTYLVSKFGEDSEEANSTREEIAALQRASRDAKPFKAHRSLLERKRERLQDKQKRDEAEVERITNEVEELQSKLRDLKGVVQERAKQIAEVEEELAELVRKALAEGDAAGPAGKLDEDSTAPWSAQAASAALQAMATKPGVPPEFAALLANVFQAAQAMANAAASARPAAAPSAPSTAEGGEQQSHRGDQQRQQRPPQQGQPQKPSDAVQPSTEPGASSNRAAACAEGKGSISSLQTAPLAPQGRWAKGAGGAACGTSSGASGSDMQVDEGGAVGSQGAESGSGQGGDSGAEMLEEEPLGPGLDDGVAASINKLPAADQEKLKAALGVRGGRRKPTTDDSHKGATEGRDRERSPRPTKGGAVQEDV